MLLCATKGTGDGAYGIIDEGLKEINCGVDLFARLYTETVMGNTEVRHKNTMTQSYTKIPIYVIGIR